MTLSRQSILVKLILLTAVVLTVVFVCTGYLLERDISARATQTLEEEVVTSFQAYQSLWQEHTENLREVSSVISRMADVRAAFRTNDRATIQDTAGELWSHISAGNALFMVADGEGRVIASLGERTPFRAHEQLAFLENIAHEGRQQRAGFFQEAGRLFQIVITPVYVDAERGQDLIDILVTGFELDHAFLHALKTASGGSDLIFKLHGRALASTLSDRSEMRQLGDRCSIGTSVGQPMRLQVGSIDYLALNQSLPSLQPADRAELCIVRSLATSQRALNKLLQRISLLWLAGLVAAIVCTYFVARRMVRPIRVLDQAAAEIAGGNYQVQVEAKSDDELGRLGRSFNTMCSSLEEARVNLIRHERLSSVARLAAFVAHDLRNPLASIYAGAEMLVDNELPAKQVKRLAHNMYQASRGVLAILQELLSAASNKTQERELCSLHDLVATAWNELQGRSEASQITFKLDVPHDLELALDRAPMERVFHNLIENAIEAIAGPGTVSVWTASRDGVLFLHIEDSGGGIPPELRKNLFQPFASQGRAGGWGLGLALSRQTLLAHGGDLWAEFERPTGGHFVVRLPLSSPVLS